MNIYNLFLNTVLRMHKTLLLTMPLLFKNEKSLLAFIAGIYTTDSLPSRSQAQLFTVPKCTFMKAAQNLQDNLIDTRKNREYELDFCL